MNLLDKYKGRTLHIYFNCNFYNSNHFVEKETVLEFWQKMTVIGYNINTMKTTFLFNLFKLFELQVYI